MQVSGPLKEARERAMHGDPDLAALLKEIQSKQGELEAKLLQKHPDVAKMMKDRDALMATHAEVYSKLMELRRKLEAASQ